MACNKFLPLLGLFLVFKSKEKLKIARISPGNEIFQKMYIFLDNPSPGLSDYVLRLLLRRLVFSVQVMLSVCIYNLERQTIFVFDQEMCGRFLRVEPKITWSSWGEGRLAKTFDRFSPKSHHLAYAARTFPFFNVS